MKLSRTGRIGVAAVAGVVLTRVVLGNFVVNDWEGWGTFVPTAIGAIVEGLLLGLVLFGLVVRLAAKSRGRRPAITACVLGILGLLALAIPYSAPQPILGAAAVALALVAAERGEASRRTAAVGMASGLAVITVWLAFMAVAVATGDWPVNY